MLINDKKYLRRKLRLWGIFMIGNETKASVELYKEIDFHLMNDETPSLFLSEISWSGEFKEYPFSLIYELKNTPQSPQHHPEGSAWNHTLMVTDQAAKNKSRSRDPRAFMWAALLHDIGKPSTTRIRNGRITSYDHDTVGAELVKDFFGEFNEKSDFVNKVSNLVKYHMQILFVSRKMPWEDIRGIRENSDAEEIALLGLCDRLGRKGADQEEEQENIRLFLEKFNEPEGNGNG